MSKHFSELSEHNHVSSAMYPECPAKDWRGKSCWLNPRESDTNVVQGPGGVTTSPTLLGPVLVWSQQNYLKLLLLIVRFFKSSYGCCPRQNRTFRSGRFGMSRFGHDISVHKQLIAFVYLNAYQGQVKCHASWCCTNCL